MEIELAPLLHLRNSRASLDRRYPSHELFSTKKFPTLELAAAFHLPPLVRPAAKLRPPLECLLNTEDGTRPRHGSSPLVFGPEILRRKVGVGWSFIFERGVWKNVLSACGQMGEGEVVW